MGTKEEAEDALGAGDATDDGAQAETDSTDPRRWENQSLGTESSQDRPAEVVSVEDSGPSSAMPSFLKDEIAPILAAAERAATQIVDRAREQARVENENLDRRRQEVEVRIQEMVAWQERVEPSIRSLQSKVADIQTKIDEVPELIRKALDPVATAISSLDPTLAEVASASRPVLELEPLNIEATRSYE
jgi:chromosome segregation ATPase